jgi:hypothetical protein
MTKHPLSCNRRKVRRLSAMEGRILAMPSAPAFTKKMQKMPLSCRNRLPGTVYVESETIH